MALGTRFAGTMKSLTWLGNTMAPVSKMPQLFLFLRAVAVASLACVPYACKPGDSGEESAHQTLSSTETGSAFRKVWGTFNQAATGCLKPGQIVITIDESPAPGISTAIANHLQSEGIAAVFFLVGDRLVPRSYAADPCSQNSDGATSESGPEGVVFACRNNQLDPVSPRPPVIQDSGATRLQELKDILDSGHFIANHSFTHPVRAKGKLIFDEPSENFDQLSAARAAKELVWTHSVINQMMGALPEGTPKDRFLKWFRPPGGSWPFDSQRSDELSRATFGMVSNYVSPTLWSVPARPSAGSTEPKADWQFFQLFRQQPDPTIQATFVESTVQSYLRDLEQAKHTGLVLFHANLQHINASEPFSLAVIKSFVKSVRERGGVEIVDPRNYSACL